MYHKDPELFYEYFKIKPEERSLLEKAFGKKNVISFSNIDKTEEREEPARNSIEDFGMEESDHLRSNSYVNIN